MRACGVSVKYLYVCYGGHCYFNSASSHFGSRTRPAVHSVVHLAIYDIYKAVYTAHMCSLASPPVGLPRASSSWPGGRPFCLQPPHIADSDLHNPLQRHALPLHAHAHAHAPSHVERRCVARLTVSGLRAWQLRRAREAHWSAPCLGSFERKRSLAMRMRRSFMSSFSFSKSNWPRSISGEEMGGRICSGSSSKYA